MRVSIFLISFILTLFLYPFYWYDVPVVTMTIAEEILLDRANITSSTFVSAEITKEELEDVKLYTPNADWLISQRINENLLHTNYEKCEPCKTKVFSKTANSSPFDIILTILYGKDYYNIISFVRSLRSTGCKATVILMHTEEWMQHFPSSHKAEVDKCGVIWVNVHEVLSRGNVGPITSRFILFRAFLHKYINKFNRVIICDLFDTFFQLDPFDTSFKADLVYATTENDNLAFNFPNAGWISAVDKNFSRDFYLNKRIICLGLLFGGVRKMYEVLSMFASEKKFLSFGSAVLDQPVFNYYHYRGMFGNIVNPDTDAEHMVSATKWQFERKPNCDFLMVVTHPESARGRIPTAIHQYDRSVPLRNYIAEKCPILGNWQSHPYAKNAICTQR